VALDHSAMAMPARELARCTAFVASYAN
jgi:hypothetical protein